MKVGTKGVDGEDRRTIEPTFVAHETGHTLGLGHSFTDSDQGCCGSGTPGEYCDPWDIMSAMCVFRIDREPTARDSGAGPLLGAPHMDQLGWLDPGRMTRWAPPQATVDITLAPLHFPRDPGALAVRVDLPETAANPVTTFFIELRIPESWDGGLPRAAVLIRKSQPQLRSILVGSGRQGCPDLEWRVGDTFISGGANNNSPSHEPRLRQMVVRSSVASTQNFRCLLALGMQGGWNS